MMLLLSHSTKSPSTITGTRPLGFCLSSGPSSARVWAMPISSQVHRTLRTLIDEALPRMRITENDSPPLSATVWPVMYSLPTSIMHDLRALLAACRSGRAGCARPTRRPAHHVGLDQRRRHGVHRDAVLDQPRRVAARHAFHAGLGGVVVRPDAAGAARRARGDVDDAAPSARAHAGHHGLGAEEDRLQVHRDGEVEVLLGELVDGADQRDAGVVDQHVDRPQLALDAGHHAASPPRPARHRRRPRSPGRPACGSPRPPPSPRLPSSR